MNPFSKPYSEKKGVDSMAFGYALLKGRAGAMGYVRENGSQREISARDLPPNASCSLYAVQEEEYRLCGTKTTDSGGSAKWTAPKEGHLILAEGDKVLLWDGGDEAFLRASAWLKRQSKGHPAKPVQEKEGMPEAQALPPETLKACTFPAQDRGERALEHSYPFERQQPGKENAQAKESPPERAYTLRPAGTGEPVDTLPERQRR